MVSPVDDALPRFTTGHIKAQAGARKVVSQFELEATDADTRDSLIVFTVALKPTNGELQLASGDDYAQARVSGGLSSSI